MEEIQLKLLCVTFLLFSFELQLHIEMSRSHHNFTLMLGFVQFPHNYENQVFHFSRGYAIKLNKISTKTAVSP